jgi:murein DD-endopeptidase MepM/ murein hydrolase activator NlpD
MQFMPSTWLRWGVDADGDGVANPWSAQDAVYAAARYLAASGGQTEIARAVFAYNHAQWYVDEVLQLAGLFDSAGAGSTFTLDQLGQRLGEARVDVVRVNRQLVRALRVERALRAQEARAAARARRAELLSDRLAAQKRAVQVGVRADAAAAHVSRLKARLGSAEAALLEARQSSQAASFAPAAGALLQSPTYDGNYVFPVGGGPAAVSVSHTHHDYPAADIAAPEGSPVYALADAVVLRAWRVPDARCGIGLTLQTSDGQTWTYCHLAYLESSVVGGATLAAGDAVGLVGHTGDATGPHLHLQIDPPTSYPQQQPWFQRFAGTAFRWSDGGGTDAGPAGPVFRVMDSGPEGDSAQTQAAGAVIAFRR